MNTLVEYPDAHLTNPHYRADLSDSPGFACHRFNVNILAAYGAMNARRAAQHEAELVRISGPPEFWMLELNELINKGDEWRMGKGHCWGPVCACIGGRIEPRDVGNFRRRLTD